MARTPKYKKKFAKELNEGLRLTGLSIERCCLKWGITTKTYYNWKEEYTSFADAVEIGERDYKIFWQDAYLEGVKGNGNAQLLKTAAANVYGWSDKKVVENKNDAQIHQVEISVLPPPDRTQIEHKETESNIIDINEYEQVIDKPDETPS